MAKKKTSDQKHVPNEWDVIFQKAEKAVELTLDAYRVFGTEEGKQVPLRLEELGVLSDGNFVNFLISLYNAAQLLGPEAADKIRREAPESKVARYHELNMEEFLNIFSVSATAAAICVPIKSDDMSALVETIYKEPALQNFLFEFVNTVITQERIANMTQS